MFQILATCSVEVDHLHSTPHLQVKRSYVYFLKTALCYLTALSCVRRLLFTQIWKPPLVPRPIPDSFGGRVCNVQLRFSKTQTTPDQPGSAQHQWTETEAVLHRGRVHFQDPTSVPLTRLRRANFFYVQRRLFLRHIPPSQPKRWVCAGLLEIAATRWHQSKYFKALKPCRI